MEPHIHKLHIAAGRAAGEERTCGKKMRYPSEESAVRAADGMNRKATARNVLDGYPCAFCEQWHVGRKMSDEELARFATE